MTEIEFLMQEYDELDRGVCHPKNHSGLSELFACYKAMHPRSRISKDNFYVCYLYDFINTKQRDYLIWNWGSHEKRSEIVRQIYIVTTGKKIKRARYPEQSRIYKTWQRYPRIIKDALLAQRNWLEENTEAMSHALIQPSIHRAQKRAKSYLIRMAKIYEFIKEKGHTTIRDLSRRFQKVEVEKATKGSNEEQKKKSKRFYVPLLPYLLDLSDMGLIHIDQDRLDDIRAL